MPPNTNTKSKYTDYLESRRPITNSVKQINGLDDDTLLLSFQSVIQINEDEDCFSRLAFKMLFFYFWYHYMMM